VNRREALKIIGLTATSLLFTPKSTLPRQDLNNEAIPLLEKGKQIIHIHGNSEEFLTNQEQGPLILNQTRYVITVDKTCLSYYLAELGTDINRHTPIILRPEEHDLENIIASNKEVVMRTRCSSTNLYTLLKIHRELTCVHFYSQKNQGEMMYTITHEEDVITIYVKIDGVCVLSIFLTKYRGLIAQYPNGINNDPVLYRNLEGNTCDRIITSLYTTFVAFIRNNQMVLHPKAWLN
jgi:hypothetical protein